MTAHPSREEIASLLKFDPESGVLTWHAREEKDIQVRRWNARYAGKPAGCLHHQGYLKVHLNKRAHLAHRLAWLLAYGDWPECQIDHVNGARADNRLVNLRLATPSQNQANSRTPKTNTTGFKGVTFVKRAQNFRAQIKVQGRRIMLGDFMTAAEAGEAYAVAARRHQGAFARTA